jgi:hypothetical protein
VRHGHMTHPLLAFWNFLQIKENMNPIHHSTIQSNLFSGITMYLSFTPKGETTCFYIVRAVLSLKFETIYRIERYVCNPIFLLIIIHGILLPDTIVAALRLDIAPRSPTSRPKILKAARSS